MSKKECQTDKNKLQAKCCHDVKHISIMLPNTLMQLYDGNVQNANDALVVVLHTLMMETGFLPTNLAEEKHEHFPEEWKTCGVYKIRYYHITCPEVFCLMTCVPLNPVMAVHGTTDSPYNTNIFLPVFDYINDSNELSDSRNVYHHLVELSKMFKDQFAYNLLADLQHAAGIKPTFGICGLMTDVKFELLNYLPVESLVTISAVNKEFFQLANSSFLWKKLYQKDFPDGQALRTRWIKMHAALCQETVDSYVQRVVERSAAASGVNIFANWWQECQKRKQKDVPPTTSDQHNWKELYKENYVEEKRKKNRLNTMRSTTRIRFPRIFHPNFPNWDRRFIYPERERESEIDLYQAAIPPQIHHVFPHVQRRSLTENPLRHMLLRNQQFFPF